MPQKTPSNNRSRTAHASKKPKRPPENDNSSSKKRLSKQQALEAKHLKLLESESWRQRLAKRLHRTSDLKAWAREPRIQECVHSEMLRLWPDEMNDAVLRPNRYREQFNERRQCAEQCYEIYMEHGKTKFQPYFQTVKQLQYKAYWRSY